MSGRRAIYDALRFGFSRSLICKYNTKDELTHTDKFSQEGAAILLAAEKAGVLSPITPYVLLSPQDLLRAASRRGILPWDIDSIIEDPSILCPTATDLQHPRIHSILIRLIIKDKLREVEVNNCVVMHQQYIKGPSIKWSSDPYKTNMKEWSSRIYTDTILHPHSAEIDRVVPLYEEGGVPSEKHHSNLLELYCTRVVDANVKYKDILSVFNNTVQPTPTRRFSEPNKILGLV